jgi:hypothetical protein
MGAGELITCVWTSTIAPPCRIDKIERRAAKRGKDHRQQEVFDLTMLLQYMSAILF